MDTRDSITDVVYLIMAIAYTYTDVVEWDMVVVTWDMVVEQWITNIHTGIWARNLPLLTLNISYSHRTGSYGVDGHVYNRGIPDTAAGRVTTVDPKLPLDKFMSLLSPQLLFQQ